MHGFERGRTLNLFCRVYITIYVSVCVPHFNGLSAMVGCWSSISIRRIIYKLLNMRLFDNTAVVLSGKVKRS